MFYYAFEWIYSKVKYKEVFTLILYALKLLKGTKNFIVKYNRYFYEYLERNSIFEQLN